MPGAARRTRATARLDDDDDDDDIVAPSKSIAVKTEKKKDASVDDKKLVQSKIAFQANGAASTDSTATATAPAAGGASAIKQEASVHADKKPRLGLRFVIERWLSRMLKFSSIRTNRDVAALSAQCSWAAQNRLCGLASSADRRATTSSRTAPSWSRTFASSYSSAESTRPCFCRSDDDEQEARILELCDGWFVSDRKKKSRKQPNSQ